MKKVHFTKPMLDFTYTISSRALSEGSCHIASKIFLLHGMVLHPTLYYGFTCLITCESLNSD